MDKTGHELTLPKTKVKKAMKDRTNKRVAGDAALRLCYQEEMRITDVTQAAAEVADAAGRETIKEKDIVAAYAVEDLL